MLHCVHQIVANFVCLLLCVEQVVDFILMDFRASAAACCDNVTNNAIKL